MTVFEMNNKIEEAFHPKIDKYVMYLRKSRADLEAEKDGEGETLARHKKILTELAVRKGLYVEKIYEEVVSGETIEDRKEIQKLIQECYEGKYRGIIVIEISRLSRGNQRDAQTILDCLRYSDRNKGVLVVTPSKTYDIANNHDDEEYMEFELFMSRREYKMIKRRMDRGKIQAIVEGNFMGSTRPYGYNIVTSKRSRYLVPNKDEAPYVRLIFEWTAHENMSHGKVAARLNDMGVPSFHNVLWDGGTIRNILRNYAYIGKVEWYASVRTKTMVGNELVTKTTRYSDQHVLYDGKHKAIIDEDLFNLVQKRFKFHRTRDAFKLKNPLAGLVQCSKCGRTLRYKAGEKVKTPRFVHAYNHNCFIKSIKATDLVDALIHALKLYIEDFELKLDNKPMVNRDSISLQIQSLQTELRRIEQKKAKLFDGWEDGKITDNEFVERKTVAAAKIESITAQISELESSIPEQEILTEKLASLHQAIDIIYDEDIDAVYKNEFFKRLLNKVEVSRENDIEFILDVFLN